MIKILFDFEQRIADLKTECNKIVNKILYTSFQPQILGVEILEDGDPALFLGGCEVPGAADGPADTLEAPEPAAEGDAAMRILRKGKGKT